MKQIKLLCCSLRVKTGNYVRLEYILQYDNMDKRYITIQGPYKNFILNHTIPVKMKNIFLTLMRKSGYSHTIDKEGNIHMTFSEFMNFKFEEFKDLVISNKLT